MDALQLDAMVYPSFLDPPRFIGDDLGPVGEQRLPPFHVDSAKTTWCLKMIHRTTADP